MAPFYCTSFFKTHLPYNVQSVGTHFQFHTKMRTPHHYKCKKVIEWNMIGTQNGYHLMWQSLGVKLIWLQNLISVTNLCHQPSINFSAISPVNWKTTKLLIQCALITWAKFNYHRHQCHLWPHFTACSFMEVGQIFRDTFSNVSKNHDPSPLQVQKSNKMKYDTQTKMVSYDLGHVR